VRVVALADVSVPVRGIAFASGDVEPRHRVGIVACVTTSAVQATVDWSTARYIPDHYVKSDAQLLRPGDVLVSTANSKPLVGKAVLVRAIPGRATFGAFVTVLRAGEGVDPEYLNLWMQTPGFLRTARDLASQTTSIANLRVSDLMKVKLPLPSLPDQRRIATELTGQLTAAAQIHTALTDQRAALQDLIETLLRVSLDSGTEEISLGRALREVAKGVGEGWSGYALLGATRGGIAPAKERVGATPERYKLVIPGTIFYNPMRILLGSIARLDDDDVAGITSPDYVVFRTDQGALDDRWFYHWLRSWRGEALIKSLARGAVRERLLFKRLAAASIRAPSIGVQVRTSAAIRRVSEMLDLNRQSTLASEGQAGALLRKAFSELAGGIEVS
jgi:type I restriction enzyme, S subunit